MFPIPPDNARRACDVVTGPSFIPPCSHTCPQAYRRHPMLPRHIPPAGIVLKGHWPPGSSTEPIREQHFQSLAAMNISAVPGQTIPLLLMAYLQYLFLHYLHVLYSAQFSRSSSGTRSNSRTLFVTRVIPSARAWAAISISSGPIGVPRLCKWSRISPYSDAAPIGKRVQPFALPFLGDHQLQHFSFILSNHII